MIRKNGRMVQPPVTRQWGAQLTFAYEEFNGASVADNLGNPIVVEDFLKTFIAAIYPKIVALYGPPSASSTVKIKSMGFFENGSASEVQRLAFGAYNVSENRIYLPLYRSVDSIAHAVLLNIIHAFHGRAAFQYDAWEQGFARAAATVIARDPALGFLDPTANNLYTLLPEYDLNNQPPLGNSTFFPPSQANIPIDGQFTIAKMLQPRMGMSGAAWLKAYIENPAFFRNFNAAYYTQFDPDATPSLAGNVPGLRSIAASVLPNVEGLPFNQWYERQYVLDTSVTGGDKLYAFVLPSEASTSGGQSALIALVYYRTKEGGDEELKSGRGFATYFDALGFRIPSLGSSSEQTQIESGEGFLTTLAFPSEGFDDGRLTMDFTVGNLAARTYLPSGITGDLRSVIVGADAAGTVAISQTIIPSGATRTGSATIARAGFGVTVGSVLGELARTTFTITNAGIVTTHKRNTGDGINWLALPTQRVATGTTTVSKVFSTGVSRLVSFPVRPLNPSVTTALGLPATDFVLTQWDPLRSVYEMVVPDKPVVGALTPGRGYWLRLLPGDNSVNYKIDLEGVPPATDTDFTLGAAYGWNLIGSPFSDPIDIEKVLVKFLENDPVTWQEAIDSNLVAAQPFELNEGTGAYTPASSLDGGAWKGYWLRVYAPAGVTLLLPGPDAPDTRAVRVTRSVTPRRTTPEWSLSLTAASDKQRAQVRLGAAPGATRGVDARWDTETPPDTGTPLSLEFVGEGTRPSGGRQIGDFRAASDAARGTWKLKLTSPSGKPVTLAWTGLGSVPRGVALVLTDPTTGKRTPLSARSGLTLTLPAGQSRTLTLTAETARSLPLAFSRLRLTPTSRASGGVRVEYALTGEAEVEAEVTTFSGRPMRRLESGRRRAAEAVTLSWDGRGDAGQALPAGTYLLTLTARADDGTVVRQTRPVSLIR